MRQMEDGMRMVGMVGAGVALATVGVLVSPWAVASVGMWVVASGCWRMAVEG